LEKGFLKKHNVAEILVVGYFEVPGSFPWILYLFLLTTLDIRPLVRM